MIFETGFTRFFRIFGGKLSWIAETKTLARFLGRACGDFQFTKWEQGLLFAAFAFAISAAFFASCAFVTALFLLGGCHRDDSESHEGGCEKKDHFFHNVCLLIFCFKSGVSIRWIQLRFHSGGGEKGWSECSVKYSFFKLGDSDGDWKK